MDQAKKYEEMTLEELETELLSAKANVQAVRDAIRAKRAEADDAALIKSLSPERRAALKAKL